MTTQTDSSIAAEVEAAEDLRVKATGDQDWATLEELIADDLTYSHTNGKAENKAGYLSGVKGRARTMNVISRDVKVLGDNAAVLTGRIEFVFDDKSFTTVATAVWSRRDGAWKLTAFHASKIEPQFL